MISIGTRVRLLKDVTLHYMSHDASDNCPEGCIGEHVPSHTLGTVSYVLNDGDFNDFGVDWDNGDCVEVREQDVKVIDTV